MTTVNDLEVGETISFETIAPDIINLKYTKVVFEGLVGWSVARSFDDIASLHAALWPSMNQNENKNDYRSYSYLTFQTTEGPNAGITQVLGVPWIRQDTLEVSGSVALELLFPNISPNQKTYLFQLLKANGFTNFQVTEGQ